MINSDIEKLFLKIFKDISLILDDNFYSDKGSLEAVKVILDKWHIDFKEKQTLKTIEPKELEFVSLEITDLFDKYIETESVVNNYIEQLSYDFSILEKEWKAEMLEDKKNV